MDTARIAALLEPFLEQPLLQPQLQQISIYINLLLRWNARINLTAIRNEEEIVTRHFGESLFLARHLFEPESELEGVPSNPRLGRGFRVIDIGSGAGFPAIPLKIWAPSLHLTLIESNHKKAAFLNEVARALALSNIDVMTDRAQAIAARKDFPRADVVTLRAVERFDTILPGAVTLLAPNGTLALLITTAQITQLALISQLNWRPPFNVPQSHTRVLQIGVMKSGNKVQLLH
jgi:16S rRNA (guanine527-N7)-methyltransferase